MSKGLLVINSEKSYGKTKELSKCFFTLLLQQAYIGSYQTN